MNSLIIELINIYIKNEVENMILYIKLKYPKILKKDITTLLINKYGRELTINIKDYNKKERTKIYYRVQKKIFIRKFRNKALYYLSRRERDNNLTFNKNKCRARIWNNGSILKLETGIIKYGKQCSKNKLNKHHCYQHSVNNPHANFDEKPSNDLIKHYEKYKNKL